MTNNEYFKQTIIEALGIDKTSSINIIVKYLKVENEPFVPKKVVNDFFELLKEDPQKAVQMINELRISVVNFHYKVLRMRGTAGIIS